MARPFTIVPMCVIMWASPWGELKRFPLLLHGLGGMNYPKSPAVGEHRLGSVLSVPTLMVGSTMPISVGFIRILEKAGTSGYGMNNWVGIGQHMAFTHISSCTPPQIGSIS